MPTNDDPKEKQVEIAQVWDLVAQVGYFSSSSKKDVHDFLHTAYQAARDNNMSSARVAKIIRFQLLKGKAKTSADTMLAMPHCYPKSNYYCEQLRVQGRLHRLFQEAITHRIPSVPSTDGEIRSHSSDEINLEDSVASVASIAAVQGDPNADPPIYQPVPMSQEFLIDPEDTVTQLNTDVHLQLILYTIIGGTYPHGQRYLIYEK